MENDAIEGKRWIAVTTYHGENGPISEEHRIEEIEELDKITVEGGPDRNALVDIVIRLNPRARHPSKRHC